MHNIQPHRCPLSLEGDALGFQRRIQHSREHPLTIVDKQLRTILVQDQAQCQLARLGYRLDMAGMGSITAAAAVAAVKRQLTRDLV